MTLKRQSPWLALYTASSTGPDRSEIGPYLGSHWASSRESCHKLSLTVGTGRILLMFLRSVLGVSEAFGGGRWDTIPTGVRTVRHHPYPYRGSELQG